MRKCLITIALCAAGIFCHGQDLPAVDIHLGFGLPEAFHLGLKLHAFPKNQFGIYYGTLLQSHEKETLHSFSLDHQFHFGRVSPFSQRPPWFCRQGFTFEIDENSYARREYWFFNLSLGRESNFNDNIGISYDAGIGIILSEKKEIKGVSFFDIDFDFYVYPVVRIQLYFSFNKRSPAAVNMSEWLPGLDRSP